jgi:hypothetical protein
MVCPWPNIKNRTESATDFSPMATCLRQVGALGQNAELNARLEKAACVELSFQDADQLQIQTQCVALG